MTEPSFDKAVRSGGFILLGELFPDRVSAQMLLDGLGIKMAQLLTFGTPDIGGWWWDVGWKIKLGLFANVQVADLFAAARTRFPDSAELRRLLAATGPTTVVFLLANPDGRNRLDVEVREVDAVRREHPEQLAVQVSHATRLRDLIRVLADSRLDIVHFAGHGTRDGRLVLDGPNGGQPVAAADFAQLMVAAGHPRCIVFSSCFSGTYLPLLRGSATHVIGCDIALSDKCAVDFSAAFYRCLAVGRPVPDAYAYAVAAMRVGGCAAPMRIWGAEQ